jgi:hypothetical protein
MDTGARCRASITSIWMELQYPRLANSQHPSTKAEPTRAAFDRRSALALLPAPHVEPHLQAGPLRSTLPPPGQLTTTRIIFRRVFSHFPPPPPPPLRCFRCSRSKGITPRRKRCWSLHLIFPKRRFTIRLASITFLGPRISTRCHALNFRITLLFDLEIAPCKNTYCF